ncbi:uncharacterized protein LOC120041900 isoform X4 [Salvelinus namaycush]|uniref:Uncharacterized protein LOC120041900 isoform X4 n=1 Tax=Salvelinus namaycush TaxID=8040 RepID=A0A8U0U893_SALNM|nr:uncharacterized protein LOC120041900 isoform X4 [Salvelinus namaycush]
MVPSPVPGVHIFIFALADSNDQVIIKLQVMPCNLRFLQNDCLQSLCRALHSWVTRATWSRGGFQASVKATCVLHNFMMMNRRGPAALHHVPEERSAALHHVPEERSAALHHVPEERSAAPHHVPEERSAALHHVPEERSAALHHVPEERSAALHHVPEERSAALHHVPEERSAALQDVARMGANNAAQEAICAGDLHLLLLQRGCCSLATPDYTMHNQRLF